MEMLKQNHRGSSLYPVADSITRSLTLREGKSQETSMYKEITVKIS